MPAAAIKAIIISISIIAALGVAFLENPQIQAWLEEQRKRIAELLRSIGEELDPESRRAAEAFAYEGRTPATDASLRREASGSRDATAAATGRSTGLSAPTSETVRRSSAQSRMSSDEADERRRKGREYLAKRNQQMFELRQRRKTAKEESSTTPPTPTSFEEMVDIEGKLWVEEVNRDNSTARSADLLPVDIKEGMKQVDDALTGAASATGASTDASGFRSGSAMANPFGDEYALDRSETPKPPVPPKIELEAESEPSWGVETPNEPGSFDSGPRVGSPPISDNHDDLPYEEQIAIALALSEAENQSHGKRARHLEDSAHDADLKAAIEASLREMKKSTTGKSASRSYPLPSNTERKVQESSARVPPQPSAILHQPSPQSHWETAFDDEYSPWREPLSMAPSESDHDELYRITPHLAHAQLAAGQSSETSRVSRSETLASRSDTLPSYAPTEDGNSETNLGTGRRGVLGESISRSSLLAPQHTASLSGDGGATLVDVSEEPMARQSTFVQQAGLDLDSDSQSDIFASFHESHAEAGASSASTTSEIEVIDVVDDSDVDMLSEEGDGVATPDSWTEVGSQDGEREA